MTDAKSDVRAASWYGLAVLMAVSLFSIIDRQVFILLAEPIRKELGLSDLMLGLLQGLGLYGFAALTSFPIGWLADRHDRRQILAACIMVWCVAVVACGLAGSFRQLFFATMLVGGGEAGVTPIAFALIPQLFDTRRRQPANALYMLTSRLGVGIAIAICSQMISLAEAVRPWLPVALQTLATWRLAFFVAALPGPFLVMLLMTIPAPKLEAVEQAGGRAPHGALSHFLRRNRVTLSSFLLAMAMSVAAFTAIGIWLPIAAIRKFGITPQELGSILGRTTLVACGVGLLVTMLAVVPLRARFGSQASILVMAGSSVLGAVALSATMFATTVEGLFLIYGVHLAVVLLGNMVYPTALQDMSPVSLRSRLIAIVSMVQLCGIAIAPATIGAVSDRLADGAQGLFHALIGIGTLLLLASGAALVICARHFRVTVECAVGFEGTLSLGAKKT